MGVEAFGDNDEPAILYVESQNIERLPSSILPKPNGVFVGKPMTSTGSSAPRDAPKRAEKFHVFNQLVGNWRSFQTPLGATNSLHETEDQL
jgi:hypothetical protein